MKLFGLGLLALASADTAKDQFNEWKETFAVKYANAKEEASRYGQWMKNKAWVDDHNLQYQKGESTYTAGMNKFADLSSEEFASKYLSKVQDLKGPHPPMCTPSSIAANSTMRTSADWRTAGAVTPIKDQGQCGSCWAFSTVASLEGQWFMSSGNLVSLSEQNLVDCSQNWGNFGCNGGLMDQGFTYIHDNKGIDTEASYPYTAQDGTCVFNAANVGATLTSCFDIASGDEGALANSINLIGPIAVAIDASHISFQMYQSGVYYEPNCSPQFLDHGVTAVGYGTDATSGNDYYWVKNSWGTSWGNQGYIQMSRNRNNNCGIATASSYPQI
jgi:cathepsin L